VANRSTAASLMMGRLVLFTPGHTELGGAQRRSKLIARGLASHGWKVLAVTRAGSLHRPRLERSDGLTLLEIPGFGRRRLGAVMFFAAAVPVGLLGGLRASAFLSVQLMSTSTAAATCARLLGRPFLALATTTGELSEINYLRSTRSWGIRRRLLAGAAYLLAQTPEAGRSLEELVPPHRVAVLPNPVELPATPPPLDGRPRACFAGRLSAEKDLGTLLGAWSLLIRDLPEARLTLLGSGGAFRSVEQQIRSRVEADPMLRASVKLPGWHRDPDAVIGTHDVFVLPSREEGMSNALLEACALGRAIVASDIPPNRAVLGEGYPLLFPPTHAPQLAEALREALDPGGPARRQALEQVRQRAHLFSVDTVISRLEELIHAEGRTRR